VEFRKNLNELDQIDWALVAARDFRSADVKEAKAAEFLLHGSFPWELVERIGIHSMTIGQQVTTMIAAGAHNPTVRIEKDWYF
jgi:hypothetical protein